MFTERLNVPAVSGVDDLWFWWIQERGDDNMNVVL
jgi:hypothetical protein